MKTIAWHQSSDTQIALIYLMRTAGTGVNGVTGPMTFYRDKRLTASWEAGWTVMVNFPSGPNSTVLETDAVEVKSYRPGLWEQYVVELHREIAYDEAVLENERRDVEAKLRLEAFQPIDDAGVFPELAVKKGA
jgi:hypothetical protein